METRIVRCYMAASIGILILAALEMRAIMEYKEAMWKGGDYAAHISGNVHDVYHADHYYGYRYWQMYNGNFFDDLLNESGYNAHPSPQGAAWVYDDPYTQKEIAWASQAHYWVTSSPYPALWTSRICKALRPLPVESTWETIHQIPYQDYFLRQRTIYVMKRGK